MYHVLQTKGIHLLAGHNVPELINSDSDLHTIEMSIVERPYILDFAGARKPHEVPDFEEHVIEEHTERIRLSEAA